MARAMGQETRQHGRGVRPLAEGRITEATKTNLVAKIGELYQNWPLDMSIGMNIDGVAAEFKVR